MSYSKGEHIDWWQKLSGSERLGLMKKYGFSQANNKCIYRMHKREKEVNNG